MTADILLVEPSETSGNHLLGYVGGDDFLAIVEAGGAEDLAGRFADEFRRRIASLYDEADLRRGWVAASSRAGEPEVSPVVTLSVATAYVEPNDERQLDRNCPTS
jgi:CRISPR/Cas system-associated protein Cas10 (large subunit of type III CRISPR-Cas system)